MTKSNQLTSKRPYTPRKSTLIRLIEQSRTIESTKEQEEWMQLLHKMTPEQKRKLYLILINEKNRFDAIEIEEKNRFDVIEQKYTTSNNSIT